MKKQVLLLLFGVIIGITVFGSAVSAADVNSNVNGTQVQMNSDVSNSTVNPSGINASAGVMNFQGSNNSGDSNYNGTAGTDPEITLNVNLEHPEALSSNLPTVKVTDSDGKTIDGVTVTKTGDRQYKVNFTSDKTRFNLTVDAGGHVPQTVNVSVSQKNASDSTLYGEATVNLRAYNLLIISDSSSLIAPLVDSNKKLRDEGYYFNLNFFTGTDVTSGDANTQNKIKQMALKADLVILDMIDPSKVSKIEEILTGTNAKIMALRCSGFSNNPNINSNTTDSTELAGYWNVGGVENMKRFQLKALQKVGMAVNPSEDLSLINYPTEFIYHPDSGDIFTTWNDYLNWYIKSGHYKADAPWVGIMVQTSMFMNGNSEIHEEILRSLEAKGLNVVLAVTAVGGATGDAARVNAINKYFMDSNTTRIKALIACFGFNLLIGNATGSTEVLKKMNIPIFAPIYDYSSDLEDWENSTSGLSQEVYWQIAMPEMEGRIEPVMIGGYESAETDPYTGITVKQVKGIPDRIERLTNRVVNWIKLQTLPNDEKKIALIYYNNMGGKDGTGAFYLNVPDSISEILKALKAAGYNVSGDYSVDSIINLFLTAGNNVGSWAPGELKKVVDAGAITIPLSQYMEWFNDLPEELRNAVIAKWGPAPGNVMVYEDKIVLPGIMLGNIFVGAQPMRGWGEDPTEIIHSLTLPPTHQYIAFYMWLQNEMKANAVIHLGTHGTLEWLPGRSVGLGSDDWPDVLMGNIPDIYPYIVDNPGEGTQAKRRGYAVIIDHMTAPMVTSGLYGDMSTLQDLINSYDSTSNEERKNVLEKQIRELVTKMHLDQDLGINMDTEAFNDIKNDVEHDLQDISSTLMPYGLHTFGIALNGTVLDQMIESIVSFDPANRDNQEFRDKLREELSKNYEIESLLAALNGEFVSPALSGDPIRDPDVLPTGNNFYSFDPRTVPDKTAWEIGKKMADDLLADYYQKNGHYPESVGVVLWDIETMRTNGQTLAMILRLLGLEPVWDSSNRVKSLKVTPLSELQRPRVDVMVTISGCFRDTFSYALENVLYKAFNTVANLSESTDDNFFKKHYQEYLEKYLKSGMTSDKAEALAKARVFGPPPGSYVSALENLVPSTSGWNDQSDLVNAYLAQMSYVYGTDTYGSQGLEVFKNQLGHVQADVQVMDDSGWGILDNDDVYAFLGGLTMTVKSLYGTDVSSYIANTRSTPKIETLNQFMDNEIRTRLLNPKWIQGMLNEGFSGAHEINQEIGYMFAWNAVTPDTVKDWMWQGMAQTYAFDSSVRSQMLQANPYAYTSMLGWMLEAGRRSMWNADKATLTELANQYITYTNQYGVTCCHHTCANIMFNQWLVQASSLSSGELQQFASVVAAATGKSISVPSSQSGSQSSSGSHSSSSVTPGLSASASQAQGSASGAQSSSASQSGSAGSQSSSTSGSSSKNAHEISPVSSQSSSAASGVSFAAIIGVICIVCLVAVGYFRNRRKI